MLPNNDVFKTPKQFLFSFLVLELQNTSSRFVPTSSKSTVGLESLSFEVLTPHLYCFFQVMDEISSMENNIRDLKQAIADKENPLKVAHTRLDKRSLRPNVELCRDPVQYRLVGEVGEISVSIDRLRMRLAEAEASLMALLRNKERLEDDIEVKTNSLFIDRDQCMVIRQQVRHISH